MENSFSVLVYVFLFMNWKRTEHFHPTRWILPNKISGVYIIIANMSSICQHTRCWVLFPKNYWHFQTPPWSNNQVLFIPVCSSVKWAFLRTTIESSRSEQRTTKDAKSAPYCNIMYRHNCQILDVSNYLLCIYSLWYWLISQKSTYVTLLAGHCKRWGAIEM